MILSNKADIDKYTQTGVWGTKTLDQYVKQHARENPEKIAVIDPPNRLDVDGQAPESITWEELEHKIAGIAANLLSCGLKSGEVIAIHLPNTIDAPIALLAVMRAGMIACPISLLWRRSEATEALTRVAAKSIITTHKIDGFNNADMMRYVAADIFSIRYVFAFGDGNLDGVLPLDPLGELEIEDDLGVESNANFIATMCLDVSDQDSTRPVPRSHNQWIAASKLHKEVANVTSEDILLSSLPLTNLTAMASTMGPWLLTGCSLALHHPFDKDHLLTQMKQTNATYSALPATVLNSLIASNEIEDLSLTRVGSIWPLSSVLKTPPPKTPNELDCIDIYGFGEIATYAGRRSEHIPAGYIPLGEVKSSEADQSSDASYLELKIQGGIQKAGASSLGLSGELVVSGPMVPDFQLTTADKRATNEGANLNGNGRGNRFATGIQCSIESPSVPVAKFLCDEIDKSDSMFRQGNVRIIASELDSLYASYENFLDAAAFAFEDPILGQRLMAAVVPLPGAAFSLEQFASHLRDKGIALYKIPEKLVQVPSIPRNQDGSIARKKILEVL